MPNEEDILITRKAVKWIAWALVFEAVMMIGAGHLKNTEPYKDPAASKAPNRVIAVSTPER